MTPIAATLLLLAGIAQPADLSAVRARFVDPPRSAGTTTLYWMNGHLTREATREQLTALRDRDGFGGIAPLTLSAMRPATDPPYLSEEYFALYGYLLDTARELGLKVVFYDDCDFPSGTAGNQMRAKYPQSLLKYLARAKAEVTGPAEATLSVPDGQLLSVVARNTATGERRVVTREAAFAGIDSRWSGSSVGFRQPPEETARYEYLRATDGNGRVLLDERFGQTALGQGWTGAANARPSAAGLVVSDCLPMWRRDISLGEKFTVETRVTIVEGAAGLAFGVRGTADHCFWQLHAGQKALRPHLRVGGNYQVLDAVPLDIRVGQAYELKIAVDGRHVTTWLDGKQVAEHTLPAVTARVVRWSAPAGSWDVQAFVCATVSGTRQVDYLDPRAVEQFIGLTYEQFRRRFPQHWGSTIGMTFFDDLSAMGTPDCLLWTPGLAKAFEQRYGRSAEALYPALWEDIGPDTGAARWALYNTRNEAFAAGYPGLTEAWCRPLGVTSSGHPAGSYNATPLQSPGDALLFYKYQGTPLTDYIHYLHHGIDGFKIPSSAAYNWDRDLVVCEIYGNFHQSLPNDGDMLYRAGMECYARGVNYLLPHGTWYDPAKMAIVPEISWRNPAYATELPRFNRWAARCETLLRGGRHVADIGMVYPIADLAARYNVSEQRPNWGYGPLPGTDYYELIRLLSGELRRDFTLLHPETLDRRCRVDGRELLLDNERNWERYRVLLLPACRTISVGNLAKVKAFADAGGKVVATTCLPEKSAEFGRDAEVKKLSDALFGPGGRGLFVPHPDEQTLLAALDGLGLTWDVRLDGVPAIPRIGRGGKDPAVNQSATYVDWYEGGGRQFAYQHRVLDGADIYFFANSSPQPVTAEVTLRGGHELEVWDPYTGDRTPLQTKAGGGVTRAKLELPALRCVFWVGR